MRLRLLTAGRKVVSLAKIQGFKFAVLIPLILPSRLFRGRLYLLDLESAIFKVYNCMWAIACAACIEKTSSFFCCRFNVICNVDIGLGERHRKAFLQRMAVVKNALIPTPTLILVVGDCKNRSGGPLDSLVGCSGLDLSIMRDGTMKKRLEDVARIVKEIRDPAFLEAMVNMGQESTPPSQSHALVMEALIILLSPQTIFHDHIPCSSLRGVTWTEARHILGHPDQLCTAIARVDAQNIPPENVCTLQVSES